MNASMHRTAGLEKGRRVYQWIGRGLEVWKLGGESSLCMSYYKYQACTL
jgi:hypothetical protein